MPLTGSILELQDGRYCPVLRACFCYNPLVLRAVWLHEIEFDATCNRLVLTDPATAVFVREANRTYYAILRQLFYQLRANTKADSSHNLLHGAVEELRSLLGEEMYEEFCNSSGTFEGGRLLAAKTKELHIRGIEDTLNGIVAAPEMVRLDEEEGAVSGLAKRTKLLIHEGKQADIPPGVVMMGALARVQEEDEPPMLDVWPCSTELQERWKKHLRLRFAREGNQRAKVAYIERKFSHLIPKTQRHHLAEISREMYHKYTKEEGT